MDYFKKPLSLGELYDMFGEDLHYSEIKKMEGITLEDLYYIEKLQPKVRTVINSDFVKFLKLIKNCKNPRDVKILSERFFHVLIDPKEIDKETSLEEKYDLAYKEAIRIWEIKKED
ncbi:MAG: hypothetical protein GXO22_04275 [Aquificae bacterium]|nr:hypothetical protein [Aquificota bacterium]